MAQVLRRGVVEIETLRRYGRVPPGTRARGYIGLRLTDRGLPDPEPFDSYFVEYGFRIGDDPRIVAAAVHVAWRGDTDAGIGETLWSREVDTDLFSYALREVTEALEREETGRGNQRFRVIRIAWRSAEGGGANTA